MEHGWWWMEKKMSMKREKKEDDGKEKLRKEAQSKGDPIFATKKCKIEEYQLLVEDVGWKEKE